MQLLSHFVDEDSETQRILLSVKGRQEAKTARVSSCDVLCAGDIPPDLCS
jgi:hypothetical protein